MTVRSLRRGSIAASRAGGTLTTYTLFAAVDGQISSNHSTYSIARAGSSLALDNDADAAVGQLVAGNRYCYESFLSFDTSAVAGVVQSATLSLYGSADGSTVDFVLEARLHDWGATLETGDWVAGADLAAKTLVASYNTAGGWSTSGYNAFTSEAAFVSGINQSGSTRLVLSSSRQRNADVPPNNEYVIFYASEDSGTSRDPKLVIVSLV